MAEASAQHARTSYTVQSLIYWACKRPTQKCVNRWELDKQAANVVHYPTTSVVLFVGSCFDEWKTQDQLCLVRLVLLDHSSLCKTPGPVCQQLMPVQLHHFFNHVWEVVEKDYDVARSCIDYSSGCGE